MNEVKPERQESQRRHLPYDKAMRWKMGICSKRTNVVRWKRYEPHCPSRACTEGHGYKLRRIDRKPNWLGQRIWGKKKEGEILCRCSHCGLVWFQERSQRIGFEARSVGTYDDLEHPWECVPLKGRHRIREENTSRYWYNIGRNLIRPPMWGGVD